jgi:membrane protein
LLDRVPGALLRPLQRFVDIEGAQLATVLAAQAFTSLIPFFVVSSAIGTGDEDFDDRVVERFDLSGDAARDVETLFADAGDVESTVTWVGVVILVLSALSFTRALQRTFQRAYGIERSGEIWRGLLWLALAAGWITLLAPVRDELKDGAGIFVTVCVLTASGTVLWLMTPWLLLGGALDIRTLLPGAAVSGFAGTLLSVASAIYMPILLDWSAERYGLIGIAFGLQSWLLALAFVIVVAAVIGAIVTESEAA